MCLWLLKAPNSTHGEAFAWLHTHPTVIYNKMKISSVKHARADTWHFCCLSFWIIHTIMHLFYTSKRWKTAKRHWQLYGIVKYRPVNVPFTFLSPKKWNICTFFFNSTVERTMILWDVIFTYQQHTMQTRQKMWQFKLINQPDATVSQVYYLTFMFRSTCFGRPHAHHQELTAAWTASGFTSGRGGSSVVGRGLAGPARPRPTTLLPPRSKVKPEVPIFVDFAWNTKQKLHRTIAAIWYNKSCRDRNIKPNYVNIRIKGNNKQCKKRFICATQIICSNIKCT